MKRPSGMGDYQQGRGLVQDIAERLLQRLGVQGGEALVQDQDVGALEQGAGECTGGCARRG
jgi:hypothetical protein